MASTEEKLKAIIAGHIGISESDITENSSFEDLGCDSLDVIELVIYIEDEFRFEIPDEDIATLKTVQDVVKYIDAHKK